MLKISGTVRPSFEHLRKTFSALWNDIEVGAGLTVIWQNETVADLWAGYLDAEQQQPWQSDTLVNVYSTSKGILAMAIASLVEDGCINLDDPVCQQWPEFGAEKKFDITVADLMSHRAGLYETGLTDPNSLLDWEVVTRKLAAAKPAWSPEDGYGYHAVSWGYLVGELIHRVTGKLPGLYIADRITNPLNADFYLGLPVPEFPRTATLIGPNRARKPQQPRPARQRELNATDPVLSPYKHLCSPAFRQSQIPATNGHASSMGLARCYQGFLEGQLVSADILRTFVSEQTRGEVDKVLGTRVRRSCGFILNNDEVPMGPCTSSFGHSGTGGSIAFADPDNRLVFAFVMNQLHADGVSRYRKLVAATYDCLGETTND